MLYIMLYAMLYTVVSQGQGALTYAGRKRSPTVYGHHHTGKQSLDINLLKAERHSAVPVDGHGLLLCADAAAPEWVTYQYRTAHPILRWLPSKLAEWIADNLSAELRIPAMKEDKWTVGELNQILANNLVPNGDGGHLRTFTTLQWECELYNGRPKARCYPFDLDGHRFRGKNPQVYNMIYTMLCGTLYNMLYFSRTVFVWWHHSRLIRLQLSPSMSRLIWI
jgi:hypothetical protein